MNLGTLGFFGMLVLLLAATAALAFGQKFPAAPRSPTQKAQPTHSARATSTGRLASEMSQK
jgi:hypothetical protein